MEHVTVGDLRKTLDKYPDKTLVYLDHHQSGLLAVRRLSDKYNGEKLDPSEFALAIEFDTGIH